MLKLVTVSYVLALGLIALFSVCGFLIVDSIIKKQDNSSTIINISGKQRRLTISIAYYAAALVAAETPAARAEARQRLGQAIDLMAADHQALTQGTGQFGLPTTLSPAMRQLYFEKPEVLDAKVCMYLEHARHLLQTPDSALRSNNADRLYLCAEGPEKLVAVLDRAVSQYDREAKIQVSNIKNTELIVLALTLSLLTCEVFLIFLPMTRTIKVQIKDILDSQRELKALFNTVGESLITFDGERKITSVNSPAQALFGRPADQMIGQSIDFLLQGKGDYIAIGGPLILGKLIEFDAQRPDGAPIAVEAVITQIDLSDKVSFIASVRDITERKKGEARISEFYAIVAHEIRSPLASMLGSLQLFQSGLVGSLNARGIELANGSVEAAKRLSRLIDDYLDLKKIASGNFEMQKEALSLHEVALAAVAGLEGMASRAGVTVELSGSEQIRAKCDRDCTIQVMTNLVSNAIKYSPSESSIHVSVEPTSDPATVRCSVADEGPGIAVSDVPKIFGMFQQATGSQATPTNNGVKGTGLGLAISKALVEQQGGRIGVEVGELRGAKFWFELPAAQ
ncbi:MAG: HAMP domain-containing histidine kinase [Cyanobacteria bacterium REEB67]|nr:HAMP domain-containing histidine kinase [Cyanobacteria bacterium REEB67]